MFDLSGQVAVITGASGGLGRQFALALARQGANIAILARREKEMGEVAEEVRALGAKCLPVVCDVTVQSMVVNAVAAVKDTFGRVDILVNNAGGGPAAPLEEMADEQWQHNMDLDLTAVFRCTREFGREMLRAGYGRVINISSVFGHAGNKQLPVVGYHAAKGGVINFTRAAACEWAERGVTVNALCPGFFPSQANSPEIMANLAPFIATFTPMARAGVDGELDSAIVFLAAKESSYITGAVLCVDGGWAAM